MNAPKNGDIVNDMIDEAKGMGKRGMAHPSTKPVLAGAVAGAAAGFLLPILSIPVGLIGGATFMLYKRAKR